MKNQTNKTKKLYGLRHKSYGILKLRISTSDSENIYNELEYELSPDGDIPWMVEDKKLVEKVISRPKRILGYCEDSYRYVRYHNPYNIDPSFYDSSYTFPVKPFDSEDLEIVEFELKEK